MVGQYTEVRVLLAPHGTRGDVQPLLALALALRARGHVARFVAPSNAVGWIRTLGFEAESNGIDVEAMIRGVGADLRSFRCQMRHVSELAPALFTSVARASQGADVIVGAGVQMASSSVAEWRDVPGVSVVFCPCAIPQSAAPPAPIRTQTLPAWLNRLIWQVTVPVADLALRGAINRGRAPLGLAPIDRPIEHIAGARVILAADPDLAPLADDAPSTAVVTDAWILPDAAALDPNVARFLDRDPAPVYIGFGSMVATRVPDLAAQAIAAARAVGRGAIIAAGWAELDRHVAPADDLLIVRSVPHDAVFPRVAAVVHHGGAGTTTAAARAGVPQVVLPHILDQYYWAHRVQRLGLGPRGLPVDLATADILADRIDAAANDPAMQQRAARFGDAIVGRNGADAAVDVLEQLVAANAPSA
jgi:vancomycin aglycone glucosyltransferase